ncbi:uncharacterized protein DUF560 [Prosthecobacter fusiformis]|uniref:Uncharacterized protein DUF560 n=1 Tax=Prosthecobacter fusiformis TaxID=48464 RepID=A0A4R7STD5_9BACT|nr:tetratricopeptide repeat protein [Prosthecobacter fusiformis]TDU81537.1 uncharacterized protein DUF560 [Prosthecobacter fusiformis]
MRLHTLVSPGLFLFTLASVSPALAQLSPTHQKLAYVVREGDPIRTIDAADSVLKQTPEDVTALRVKAIALMDQDQLPEAISLLRQAVKIDPESVACRYYLAEALATNGELAESLVLLDQVKVRAPDSEYARRADIVLPELREMVVQTGATYDETIGSAMVQVTTEPPKRFKAQIRAALEYDDNVAARSDDSSFSGPESSGRGVLGWALDFTPLQQQLDESPLTLGLTYDGYQSWHERGRLTAFDVNQNILGAYLDRQGELAGLPYRARLGGAWEYTQVGDEFFNYALGLRAQFDLQWKPWTLTSLRYDYDYKNFSEDTILPATFSRDGSYHHAGVDQYFYLCQNRLILGVGYAYRWADTTGKQFETSAHTANISMQVELPAKITWRASVNYASEDFNQYTPDPQRFDNAWMFSTSLSRPIFTDNLSVELSYNYTIADSSVAFAEYQRQVLGLGLRYRY